MSFLKNLDLYKAMILGSLLLLPLAGGFVYWVEGRLEEAGKAINAAVRSGGEIETIGKIEAQLETISKNVQQGNRSEEIKLFFERQIQESARDGSGLSSTDFQITNPTPNPIRGLSAIDQEVSIFFKRDGKDLELKRDFIYAVLFNCESQGAQVWKVRELQMVNTEAAVTRGRTAPPRTVADVWQIKKLVFARREPDK